jgi:hypothetical protein
METTFQTSTHKTQYAATVKSTSAYSRWIEKLHFSYFGIISMTILIGSIIGGIAAMYILKSDAPIWQLGLCMGIAMANNVAAIGQAPTKWVINLFLGCIGINTLLILVNVL